MKKTYRLVLTFLSLIVITWPNLSSLAKEPDIVSIIEDSLTAYDDLDQVSAEMIIDFKSSSGSGIPSLGFYLPFVFDFDPQINVMGHLETNLAGIYAGQESLTMEAYLIDKQAAFMAQDAFISENPGYWETFPISQEDLDSFKLFIDDYLSPKMKELKSQFIAIAKEKTFADDFTIKSNDTSYLIQWKPHYSFDEWLAVYQALKNEAEAQGLTKEELGLSRQEIKQYVEIFNRLNLVLDFQVNKASHRLEGLTITTQPESSQERLEDSSYDLSTLYKNFKFDLREINYDAQEDFKIPADGELLDFQYGESPDFTDHEGKAEFIEKARHFKETYDGQYDQVTFEDLTKAFDLNMSNQEIREIYDTYNQLTAYTYSDSLTYNLVYEDGPATLPSDLLDSIFQKVKDKPELIEDNQDLLAKIQDLGPANMYMISKEGLAEFFQEIDGEGRIGILAIGSESPYLYIQTNYFPNLTEFNQEDVEGKIDQFKYLQDWEDYLGPFNGIYAETEGEIKYLWTEQIMPAGRSIQVTCDFNGKVIDVSPILYDY